MASSFKRTLIFSDAVFINLGAIIGAGIFLIIDISAAAAGPAVLLSIPFAAAVAIFTGLSFSQVARHVDKEGGVYEYGKEGLNHFAGFVGGTLWTYGNIIALAAVSISFGGYIDSVLNSHYPDIIIAAGIVISFGVLNALGIKNSAKTLMILVIINVAILISFTAIGLFFFHPSHLTNFFSDGGSGIIEGAAIIFFAFSGFSRITTVSEEVVNPEKTIPRAIIASILISAALYFLISLSAVGLVSTHSLSDSTSPLALASSRTGIWILVIVVSLGALVAISGVILTGILGISRVMYAMDRDRELPAGISRLDRFSTQYVAVLVSVLLAMSMMPFASFGTIVEASNTCVLSAYAVINLAAIRIHMKYRNINDQTNKPRRDYFIAIPVVGVLTIALFFAFLGTERIIIALIVFLSSSAYFLVKEKLPGMESPRLKQAG